MVGFFAAKARSTLQRSSMQFAQPGTGDHGARKSCPMHIELAPSRTQFELPTKPPGARLRVGPNGARQHVHEGLGETMKFALHAGTVRHTNVAIDIRTARRSGFDGIELFLPKVMRYLDAGLDVAELRQLLGPLDVPMIDFLVSGVSTCSSTSSRVQP